MTGFCREVCLFGNSTYLTLLSFILYYANIELIVRRGKFRPNELFTYIDLR